MAPTLLPLAKHSSHFKHFPGHIYLPGAFLGGIALCLRTCFVPDSPYAQGITTMCKGQGPKGDNCLARLSQPTPICSPYIQSSMGRVFSSTSMSLAVPVASGQILTVVWKMGLTRSDAKSVSLCLHAKATRMTSIYCFSPENRFRFLVFRFDAVLR